MGETAAITIDRLRKEDLERAHSVVGEIPFDSERKMMTTMHRHPDGGFISFTKGAAVLGA